MTTPQVLIRPVERHDAADINLMRRMPGIAENLLAIPSESIGDNEAFITQKTKNDHLFCAEIHQKGKAKIIGMASVHIREQARQRHSASMGIMVHKDFHAQGIGSKLMAAIIDLCDNWLVLKRLDLTVFPDNEAAIRLYEKFGFIKEGTMKYASVRLGKIEDIILMARYRKESP